MIKLIKTIVDERRKLLGFIVEGKGRELEGFSDEKIQKQVPLSVLAEKGFVNNQIAVTARGIQEKGNFKINDLPMTVFINNQFVDIDNRMALKKRFIQNNEPIGFTVAFADGTMDNFTYPNVIQLSYWFKPDNFIVRKSANGKSFISGKPGMLKLEELPTEVIGEKKEKEAKRVKSAAQHQDKVQDTGTLDHDIDIIELYGYLKKVDGLVIKLPYEKYKRVGVNNVVASNEFKALGVGEFAVPDLTFNATKLNANTIFRKPGMVSIEFGPGVTMPIQSFTYNSKTIFLNSEVHVERLGVAIPKEIESEFISKFGRSLSLQAITDVQLIQSTISLTGKNNLVFYELDVNKVDLISKDRLDGYILPTDNLYGTVDRSFIPKLLAKYLSPKKGLIAELKKQVALPNTNAKGKEPIALYGAMTPEFREKITEAGIDIYTGSFNKSVRVDEAELKERADTKAKDETAVTIDYCIEGQDLKKFTYKKIVELGALGKGLPAEVLQVIQKLSGIVDLKERLVEALKLFNRYEAEALSIKNKLWYHKCAMYIKYGRNKIQQEDKVNWVLDTNRNTKAKIYNCTTPGCTGLMVALLNTEI